MGECEMKHVIGFLTAVICAGHLAGMEISSPTGHNGKTSESIDLLIDGKPETKWNAPFQRGMCCMVKLEQPQCFNSLELTAANDVPARDPGSWVVEGSSDGRTWKTLGRFLNQNGLGERFQKNVFRFSNREAYSCYRVRFLETCGDTSLQIAELKFASAPLHVPMQAASPTGHSGNAREGIANSVDGRTESKWCTTFRPGMVWQGELAEPAAFNMLTLTAANDVPARDPKSWIVEGGKGDGRWIPLCEVKDFPGFTERHSSFSFPFSNSGAYKYYRVRFLENGGDGSLQLAEIKFDLIDPAGNVQTVSSAGKGNPLESPEMAADGDFGTKWNAPANSDYSVTLDAPAAFDTLTLVSANDVPARDPKSWIVEGSVDGRNYVTVAKGREVPQFERRFMSRSFFFRNDKAYSHYRVRFPESHGDASVQLAELQLSATGGANRCPVIFSPTGHSGKAAESIQNSIDGRKETKWNCIFKKDMAWQIKYPEAQAFNTLVLTSANDVPARDPKSWVLEGLGNDGKWILLLTVTDDAGFPERLAAREFPFRNDRKFQSYRIRFQANQGDTSFQIAEIKLEKR